jgi:hypothetical protein
MSDLLGRSCQIGDAQPNRRVGGVDIPLPNRQLKEREAEAVLATALNQIRSLGFEVVWRYGSDRDSSIIELDTCSFEPYISQGE